MNHMIVGIDEAGRGPLAGVVAGCALYLPVEPPFAVKDSKLLSAPAREKIFQWLVENSVFSVNVATAQEIDRLNILQATFLAFNRAISGLLEKMPRIAGAEFIVDGPHFKTDKPISYRCLIDADKTVKEVSCASIMAKVTRDYLMQAADFLYPDWGFSLHKGYPTKEHVARIRKYSLCPLHRKSFAPCQKEVR